MSLDSPIERQRMSSCSSAITAILGSRLVEFGPNSASNLQCVSDRGARWKSVFCLWPGSLSSRQVVVMASHSIRHMSLKDITNRSVWAFDVFPGGIGLCKSADVYRTLDSLSIRCEFAALRCAFLGVRVVDYARTTRLYG